MKKALILIDYIYDFVDDKGALTAGKPAQEIKGNIEKAIQSLDENDLLIVANDCHLDGDEGKDHPESKLFPPHAIKGTKGRDNVTQDAIDNSKAKVIYIDKTMYSAFNGTKLQKILKKNKIYKIYLAGVCTDICVMHTAVDAYNLGLNASVLSSCVASFDQAGHKYALNHFKNTLGMETPETMD